MLNSYVWLYRERKGGHKNAFRFVDSTHYRPPTEVNPYCRFCARPFPILF